MIDIVGKKYFYFFFSLVVMVPGIIFWIIFGLPLGIDFTGGTLWELKFEKPPQTQEISKFLADKKLEIFSAQPSGQNIILRLKEIDQAKKEEAKLEVEKKFGKVEELRFESVGPLISRELTRKALIAIALASVAIVLYISWAFREVPKPASSFRFGICAVLALLHDVFVVVGAFAILGKFLGATVDSLFVTALLTVIGFSVHDTIVVFDRIRENLKKLGNYSFGQVVNHSILQTLGRSLNTSLTVIFVLMALLLFGGETIRWFVVALLIGIASGTYSSIFTASPLLVLWQEFLERRRLRKLS
ncbi:protein-export membrane protein SecF [Candidatus Curtissbacteria bacterium RBG_16_39_7]|uniref:Protein-export membrane protein SecF n=1 Tax=Candidatus Curtissbacteria bacterium RBG_16_39_7 TaxID=1797707 RepID=A0A1F5G1K5_9BACT|nr:MAG: protein-export membrane protein SecF [Candidatus Curtissbacteria bacterium RBG_16_39_7]